MRSMVRRSFILVAIFAMCSATGCGILGASRGSTGAEVFKQPLQIESQPSGAQVFVGGRLVGFTPCKVQLKEPGFTSNLINSVKDASPVGLPLPSFIAPGPLVRVHAPGYQDVALNQHIMAVAINRGYWNPSMPIMLHMMTPGEVRVHLASESKRDIAMASMLSGGQ